MPRLSWLADTGAVIRTQRRTSMDCDSMDCKKIREELVFLYLDREMEKDMLSSFLRHISECPHCAQCAQVQHHFLTILRIRVYRRRAPRRLRETILARLPHRRIEIR